MLFQKSKSKTLKVLNFILVLNAFFCLIALVTSLINTMLPPKYTNLKIDTDFRPIITILLILVCLCAALFVCNKQRTLFDKSKPSGLKALTAVSALVIVGLASFVLYGVVYEVFSYGDNILALLVILSGAVIYALAPYVADRRRIFSAKHNMWSDYVSVVIFVGLCGTLISFVNTMIYIKNYDCELSHYYCDSNSLPRTIITEVTVILLSIVAISTIKRLSNAAHSKEIIQNQKLDQSLYPSVKSTPENIPSQPQSGQNTVAETPNTNSSQSSAVTNNPTDYFNGQMQ